MNKPTKTAPHWMDCNCKCHGFHDNTGETCPHCHPEDHPDYKVDQPTTAQKSTIKAMDGELQDGLDLLKNRPVEPANAMDYALPTTQTDSTEELGNFHAMTDGEMVMAKLLGMDLSPVTRVLVERCIEEINLMIAQAKEAGRQEERLIIAKEVESLYQASQKIRVEYKNGQGVDLLVGIARLRDILAEEKP